MSEALSISVADLIPRGGRAKVLGSFHPGRNRAVSRQKSVDRNSLMPAMERPSISSRFSQYSFLGAVLLTVGRPLLSGQCSPYRLRATMHDACSFRRSSDALDCLSLFAGPRQGEIVQCHVRPSVRPSVHYYRHCVVQTVCVRRCVTRLRSGAAATRSTASRCSPDRDRPRSSSSVSCSSSRSSRRRVGWRRAPTTTSFSGPPPGGRAACRAASCRRPATNACRRTVRPESVRAPIYCFEKTDVSYCSSIKKCTMVTVKMYDRCRKCTIITVIT